MFMQLGAILIISSSLTPKVSSASTATIDFLLILEIAHVIIV